MNPADARRLAALISPLRRNLLRAARGTANLPDLPDAQVEIIRALPRGTVRGPGELAALLGLSRSTVSNLLSGMEARDLIVRRTVDGDRRHTDVEATPEAVRLFSTFDAASAALVDRALAALDADDRDSIHAALPALERLTEALAQIRNATGEPPADEGAA